MGIPRPKRAGRGNRPKHMDTVRPYHIAGNVSKSGTKTIVLVYCIGAGRKQKDFRSYCTGIRLALSAVPVYVGLNTETDRVEACYEVVDPTSDNHCLRALVGRTPSGVPIENSACPSALYWEYATDGRVPHLAPGATGNDMVDRAKRVKWNDHKRAVREKFAHEQKKLPVLPELEGQERNATFPVIEWHGKDY